MNAFWRKHAEQKFSNSANVLYTYLLHHCNTLYWQNPFQLSDGSLVGHTGLNKGTLRRARQELVDREMIRHHQGGQNGAGDCSVYAIGSDVVPLKTRSSGASDFEKGIDKGSKNDPLLSDKGIDMGSKNDPFSLYSKDEEKKEDEDAALLVVVGDELESKAEVLKADASAPHTRGGRGDVPTQVADPNYVRITFDETPFATPEGMSEVARNLSYSKAYAPHYIAQIRTKYSDEKRTLRDWKRCAANYLTNDARSPKGLVTADLAAAAAQPTSQVEKRQTGVEAARALRRQNQSHD